MDFAGIRNFLDVSDFRDLSDFWGCGLEAGGWRSQAGIGWGGYLGEWVEGQKGFLRFPGFVRFLGLDFSDFQDLSDFWGSKLEAGGWRSQAGGWRSVGGKGYFQEVNSMGGVLR